MLTEDHIRDALRACYEPGGRFERPLNVLDMGLVEAIHLQVDRDAPGAGIAGVPVRYRLRLTLLMAATDEDTRTQLQAQIVNRMAGLPELSATTVEFADGPAWTPSRISAEGRRMLKLDPPIFPILNQRIR